MYKVVRMTTAYIMRQLFGYPRAAVLPVVAL
jgi:hypothetical protein